MDAPRFRATGVALFATALAALTLSAGATATPTKPYSIVICGGGQTGCTSAKPAVIAPGGTVTNPSSLSVTFTNDNKPGSGIRLGSDNLNVPSTLAGFGVTSAFLPATPTTPLPQCSAWFNNSAPLCVVFSNPNTTGGFGTIGFRNLNLSPTQSIQIDMRAVTPQPSTADCTSASPCFWTDEAKQSNDFNGTGNNLNSDSNSAYGTVMSAVASCPKKQGCSTTLANGGTATSAPGSISTTVSTSTGKTTVTQIESIDFGPPLVGPTNPNDCSGVTSPHLTYENLSNGGDKGSDRSQTITINTTNFEGYRHEVCLETSMPFTQVLIAWDGTRSLAPADKVGNVFLGLLPDCSTSPPQPMQVSCSKNPGILQRLNVGDTDPVHTIVAAIPPGFDMRIGN